jgi:hypothetical protein
MALEFKLKILVQPFFTLLILPLKCLIYYIVHKLQPICFPYKSFVRDNFCYFILTSSHYFVKDLLTHATLLDERSENGLYPLKLGRNLRKENKTFTAFLGIKTTSLV